MALSGRRSSREKPQETQDPRQLYYDTPQDKIRALEQQLTKVDAQLRKAEERAAAAEAQASSAGQVDRLAELQGLLDQATKGAQVKQEKMTRLHRSIVDIYLEVRAKELGASMGRPADGIKKETSYVEKPVPGDGLDKEQMGLLAKDPHTVLEFLRASLRILLTDRRRYEAELEKTIERRASNFMERMQAMEKELEEARGRVEEEMQEVLRLQGKVAEAERGKVEVMDSKGEEVALLRDENAQLLEKLRVAEEETSMLNNWNSENMRHIQVQDEKLLKIPQMESQLSSVAMKNKAEQQKIQRSAKKKIQDMEKELSRSLKLEAENGRLEDLVENLHRETVALRRARNEPAMEKLEQKTKRMEESAMRKQKEIEKLQDAVKKLTLKLEKKDEDLGQMTKEYTRVYDALKKQMGKDERGADGMGGGPGGDAEQLQRHPYLAEVLRKKLQEREEDIQRLNVKLRHFLIIEKKMMIQQKSFQDERERYETQLSDWRIKLTRSEERVERFQRTLSAPSFRGGLSGFTAGALESTSASAGDTFVPSAADGAEAFILGDGAHSGGEPSISRPRASIRPQSAGFAGVGSGTHMPGVGRTKSKEPAVAPAGGALPDRPGQSVARPSSVITGRRLPASQTTMGTSTVMAVGDLLPQARRPSSAPRMRPGGLGATPKG